MKFVEATVATFEVFFQGTKSLVFAPGTPEASIRQHINRQHAGGNWQASSLVIATERMKEKKFAASRTIL
jgi:hypothetical protein